MIYFKTGQEKEALALVEELSRQNQGAFDNTGIPKFTAKIAEGVGFGQQPPDNSESFGTLRAKALASVYEEAKNYGLSLSDPKFNFEESLRGAFEHYWD